jgi:hypothetical protein
MQYFRIYRAVLYHIIYLLCLYRGTKNSRQIGTIGILKSKNEGAYHKPKFIFIVFSFLKIVMLKWGLKKPSTTISGCMSWKIYPDLKSQIQDLGLLNQCN